MLTNHVKHDEFEQCNTAHMSTYQERLRQAMDLSAPDYNTPTKLARAIGCTPQAIHHALSGKSNSLSATYHSKACLALKIRPTWLSDGEKPMRGMIQEALASNVEPGPDTRGTVPLINDVQAGDFAEVIDNLQPGEGERIRTSYPVRRHTFALRVTGDSMEPDFPAGIILIVEPEMEPLPGDYVIAKNGEAATFKQLVKDGNDWYLKPLNPRYPIKPLGDSRVIGVVLEATRKLR